MINIEDMKKKRFLFLNRLYELSGGFTPMFFKDASQIGEDLGFDAALTRNITRYLMEEGLVELLSGRGILISHQGVREVEMALSNPNEPTPYFPPVNISIGQMINSQIQQASHGATQVASTDEITHEQLKELLQSLKESVDQLELEPQQESDLHAEIQTIDAQMSSSNPKYTVITECLGSIRRILEGAAGSAIASGLLSKFVALWGGR
ncbi:hypothetical protein C5S31_12555 [ANME-1 cluster archaeon GoMg2]|nr:hypothetical protein [ANME-1 cluster archaeon GoMg2]